MVSLSLALGLTSGVALAEPRDAAAAQALFDEAKTLSQAGRYPEACAKLAESQRLDPGIGTQFHLANCYEKEGRLATAWATFLEVASFARASGQLDREKAALDRASQLEPLLPKLELSVPEASRVQGLRVFRDGVVVNPAQWGTKVPVDPGSHEISASGPGRRPFLLRVYVDKGMSSRIELPPLELGDAGAPTAVTPAGPVAPVASAGVAASSPGQPAPPADAKGGSSTGWVLGLGAVGVVGLGAGTAFAFMAQSSYDDSKAFCRPDDANICNQAGVELRDEARSQGNVATAAFIGGGAALAGAGLVWLLSGRTEERGSARIRAVPELSSEHAALRLEGAF